MNTVGDTAGAGFFFSRAIRWSPLGPLSKAFSGVTVLLAVCLPHSVFTLMGGAPPLNRCGLLTTKGAFPKVRGGISPGEGRGHTGPDAPSSGRGGGTRGARADLGVVVASGSAFPASPPRAAAQPRSLGRRPWRRARRCSAGTQPARRLGGSPALIHPAAHSLGGLRRGPAWRRISGRVRV